MKKTLELGEGKIALIPEGPCEKTLLNILLDGDLLSFRRDRLLDERVLDNKYRAALKFQNEYLKYTHENKLTVILVLDRFVPFSFQKLYDEKTLPPIYVITRPEIEILYILHLDLYSKYKKEQNNRRGGIKPSVFLAENLEIKVSQLKSSWYIEQNITADELLGAITEYERIFKRKTGEYTLFDLLGE